MATVLLSVLRAERRLAAGRAERVIQRTNQGPSSVAGISTPLTNFDLRHRGSSDRRGQMVFNMGHPSFISCGTPRMDLAALLWPPKGRATRHSAVPSDPWPSERSSDCAWRPAGVFSPMDSLRRNQPRERFRRGPACGGDLGALGFSSPLSFPWATLVVGEVERFAAAPDDDPHHAWSSSSRVPGTRKGTSCRSRQTSRRGEPLHSSRVI